MAWTNISGATQLDWIGLYRPGVVDTAYLVWVYTSCSQTPGDGPARGTCPLPVAVPAGTYEVRLFSNNGYARLAKSAPVTVTEVSLTTNVSRVKEESTKGGGGENRESRLQ